MRKIAAMKNFPPKTKYILFKRMFFIYCGEIKVWDFLYLFCLYLTKFKFINSFFKKIICIVENIMDVDPPPSHSPLPFPRTSLLPSVSMVFACNQRAYMSTLFWPLQFWGDILQAVKNHWCRHSFVIYWKGIWPLGLTL